MKVLFKYIKPYRNLVFLTLVLAAVNQSFSMMDPLLIGKLINFIQKNTNLPQNEFITGALTFVGMMIGVAMISRISKNFQDYFSSVIIQKTGSKIYTDGLKHAMDLPFQEFEDQRSGETLGILQQVRKDVERLVTSFVGIIFTSLVGIIFVTVVAIRVHWAIALLYFATIPILGFLSNLLSRKVKQVQQRIVGQTTSLAGSTTESLRNIELIKSLGLTDQEEERLNKTTVKILGLELEKVKKVRSIGFVQGTIVNLMRNAVIFTMAILFYKGKIEIGDFTTMFMYSFFIFNPLQELGNIIITFREAQISLQNFDKLLSKPKEPVPANPSQVGPIEKVTFDHVSFKHLTGNKKALDNITFELEKGQTVAFVGASGSGKTTLVKLLVGLYRPNEGEIRYNGISHTQVHFNELRNQLGFVTQDTQLFAGTLRENLLFVKPTANDEEMLDALHQASCQRLLERTGNGLDSVIGEGGVKLSGGEKQRISIARALLRNPQLLVFDEATSALDSITEEEITSTVRALSENKNHLTVLIAHRLSTIMHADRIFVLEKGKVIETGNHHDLVEQKGLYYALWRLQVGAAQENLV